MSIRIGFIGLGNMGASMAKNLVASKTLKKEYVMVYDINKDSVNQLSQAGAKVAANVKDIAANCNVIITMLPATAHVAGTLRGPDGIFANAKAGTIIIDSSTIDPLVSKEFHCEADGKNMKM